MGEPGATPIVRRAAAMGCACAVLTACQGDLNALDLPGTAGHGPGSFSVIIELPDVATLPQNSPVMIDDVTVGSVSGIDVVQRPDSTIYAAVRLSLDGEVELPANATARIAQTSLLGSQHVELSAPIDETPRGRLADGSRIATGRAGRYPSTEEVLSSLGVVINKGNLGALQDITDELYAAAASRAGSFSDLVPRLAELASSLDRQTVDIVAAMAGLDRFSGILARSSDALGRTLASLPDALRVLNANRANLVEAFEALRSFATVASRVLSQTKTDLALDLKDLFPVVKAFNDDADDLIDDLQLLPTFPFHYEYLRNAVRGDYLNVFSTFDLTVRRTGESLFTSSLGLDPNMKHLSEVVNPPDFLTGAMANLSGQAADPFQIPAGMATQHGDR
jgi:phospholipid/cholesterol/gamma-HCH transport system substrate-binding protein